MIYTLIYFNTFENSKNETVEPSACACRIFCKTLEDAKIQASELAKKHKCDVCVFESMRLSDYNSKLVLTIKQQ